MSKRNSQTAKTAARERLRLERERQAKRARVKRQAVVAGAVVAVLAAAGGIGYAVVQANKPSHWEAVKDEKVVAPANTTGKDGTTVVIGKASAKKTLKVYEDPRCPICAQFEQTVGSTLDKDVEDGKFKMQFVGGTFLDGDSLGKGQIGSRGEGSKSAMAALGAALNVSDTAFLEYKTALYSKKFHPDESTDKFKDADYLIKVAQTVPTLKDNATFQNAVKKGTYDAWALAMSKTFDTNKDGVTGTPSFVMDGKKLSADSSGNPPMTVEQFTTAIDAALKG
ncbi:MULTISPECIES: thioredoxin domain-containing protein [Streptomyces]|uniref:Thioredoxin domain-containing protein n=1 Tax=Streptomyces doudnae TaxID=3075536 RepID=A0ABD5EL27_9ACTN|nr:MULTISPECIES: thioredoxin domain-containing protein [unclassified Streptomyces]MDT0435325.1 thioredoxin domain-containing protein [Streptomyces sp. DSM 41981]MYQ66491.1 thioredoxin domain-containing protein [Streptomyces sp. SID4950]SCE21096.1 Protein-disulfide isomerase [Streptomyces sp. SolWspMP-5a-2]